MDFILKLYNIKTDKKISRLHGKTFTVQASWGKIKIIPLYHPAAALYSPSQITTLKKDFQALK
jgi:uracil-DNA glycosylase